MAISTSKVETGPRSGCALVISYLIPADMLKSTLAKVHKVMLPNVDADPSLAGAELAQSTDLTIYYSSLYFLFARA